MVEVVRTMTPSDRDFCLVMLEVISDLHDNISKNEEADDSFHSAQSDLSLSQDSQEARPKKKSPQTSTESDDVFKELFVNLKCLHIAQCMLENIEQQDLQANAHLVTLLNTLIVPSVRSHEAPIREKGLQCLGLCCLLDKTLSKENLTLFAHCFNKGHDALQMQALHIICDIIMCHGLSVLNDDSLRWDQLQKLLVWAMKANDSADVQSTACEIVCKLMLSSIIQDEDLLKVLVQLYFDPEYAGNTVMRQILTYFLPVYCFCRTRNQESLQKVWFVDVTY